MGTMEPGPPEGPPLEGDRRATFSGFADFYRFYLGEHANRTSRRLHVLGTGGAVGFLLLAAVLRDWRLGLMVPVCGYAFAWVGHFFFERNRPATFTHPLWSLRGDLRLFVETLTGRRPW